MQDENTPAINRRRLLRRAGTVAAGLGAAGVAVAAGGDPAAAADNSAIVQGQVNTGGDKTTTIEASSLSKPTLTLRNLGVAPALQIEPSVDFPDIDAVPVGSIFIDGYGDISTVGNLQGFPPVAGDSYGNLLYSPSWATMVVPISPWRFYDSDLSKSAESRNNNPENHARLIGGSVNSAGQIVATSSDPDAILDFSEVFSLADGVRAVQANLTVVGSASGYVTLWGSGDTPRTSSINYVKGVPIANFTQTALGADRKMRIKVQTSTRVIIDVVGFIVSDFFTQLNAGIPGLAAKGGTQSRIPQARRPAPGL